MYLWCLSYHHHLVNSNYRLPGGEMKQFLITIAMLILIFSFIALVGYVCYYNSQCECYEDNKVKEYFKPLKKKLKIYVGVWC